MMLFLFRSVPVLDSAKLISDSPQSIKSLIFSCENDFMVDTFFFDLMLELFCEEYISCDSPFICCFNA